MVGSLEDSSVNRIEVSIHLLRNVITMLKIDTIWLEQRYECR